MITHEPNGKKLTPALVRTTMLFATLAAFCATSWAASEKVLYRFHGTDGKGGGNVVVGADGSLYGTTSAGGTACAGLGCGVVFRLAGGTDGKWHETVLHNFAGSDGEFPVGSLVADKAGNLYGTTVYGGLNGCTGLGCGVAFELVKGKGGTWTYKILYYFTGQNGDGLWPYAGLAFDSQGNLYGTTSAGGNYSACYSEGGCGVVFKLTPDGKGNWAESIAYEFQGTDGGGSFAPVIFDSAGDLYGTTSYGGAHQSGTVFKLTPGKQGQWTESVLHSFNYGTTDGDAPTYGVVFDTSGSMYGTTPFGGMNGAQGWGTAFKLMPTKRGKWKETVLHSFDQAKLGGGFVSSGPVLDGKANLYGSVYKGGKCAGCGVVFKLTSPRWGETVLHFFGEGHDGSGPGGGLVSDSSGYLFGVTNGGGYVGDPCGQYGGCGVVFEITR